MSVIESLLSIDKALHTPVYLQITNGIIGHISLVTLKPETALPSSRVLAKALNVHRKTVVAAYDELYAQSWTDVYPRKGVFVARNLPDITPKPLPENKGVNGLPNNTFFDVDDKHVPFPNLFEAGSERNLVFNDGFPDTRLAPIE